MLSMAGSPPGTYKEWRAGKLLGAGACAQVFEATRVAVRERKGSAAFAAAAGSAASFVIKVAAVPQGGASGKGGKAKKATSDLKRAADTLFAEHLLYSNVLNRSPRLFGREVGYGEAGGSRAFPPLMGKDYINNLSRKLGSVPTMHAKISLLHAPLGSLIIPAFSCRFKSWHRASLQNE